MSSTQKGRIEIQERNIHETYLDSYNKCEKNEDDRNHHKKYFSVAELERISDILLERQPCLPIFLLHMQKLTVKISVDLPDKGTIRDGTGIVMKVVHKRGELCPVKSCKFYRKRLHSWGEFTVATVNHIVGTDTEARNAAVDFFLDHGNTSSRKRKKQHKKVRRALGFHVVQNDNEDDEELDWSCFQCASHNEKLIQKVKNYLQIYKDIQKRLYTLYKNIIHSRDKLVVIISHPHGGPKKVSIGKITLPKESLKTVRDNQDWCRYYYQAATCNGSSGAPIFIAGQPIAGFGYWFGHPHNHSTYDEETLHSYSSVGVDHVV
ncbi:hypothetical protein BgiBS90_035443 [Biomphalaria glabrata]|nr:hypothetical protein BgiBS90_035443 [Biomphalaria glabrata]